jgi:hypothetical protein
MSRRGEGQIMMEVNNIEVLCLFMSIYEDCITKTSKNLSNNGKEGK